MARSRTENAVGRNALRTLLAVMSVLLSVGPALADKKPRRASAVDAGYINKPIVAGATVWHCWYSNKDIHVHCMLGDPGDRSATPAPSATALPAVGQTLISSPQQFAGSTVRIPLHAVPYSHGLVGELAESVVCGLLPQTLCGVIYAESNAGLAQLLSQRKALKAERIQGEQALAAMVK